MLIIVAISQLQLPVLKTLNLSHQTNENSLQFLARQLGKFSSDLLVKARVTRRCGVVIPHSL
jgi:hypothetical protein